MISELEPVVLAQSEDDPRHAKGLCLLGDFWSTRYGLTEDIEDLAKAIQYTEQGVSQTPADDAELAARLIQFGEVLEKRYEETKSDSDFQTATSNIERALPFVSTDDSERAKGFGILGNLFSTRFKHMGHMVDLDAAIQHTQTAFLHTPEDYPHRMDGKGLIGDLLALRYERTGNLDDLNLAISSLEEGVSATPAVHPKLASRLISMGKLLFTRYDRKGDMCDLDSAIRNEERAVSVATQRDSNSITSAMEQDYPLLSIWLGHLGGHLARRYTHAGKDEDFAAASLRIHQAISMTAKDDTNYPALLDYLGNLSLSRFKKTGDVDDLESAMQYSRDVVSATPEDSPDLAGRLGNLGSRLASRYSITGDATDLNSAIDHTRRASLDTADDPHPPRTLNNLGTLLLSRYEHAGKLDDLEEAISCSQRAIDLTPQDHSDLPGYLMALGNALSARYSRTGNTDDLSRAIIHIEQAESTMTQDHPIYVKVIYSLSHFLSSRYSRTRDISDLNRAISHAQEAVDRTSETDPAYIMYMNGLGCSLFDRYKRISTRTVKDLEQAISTIQRTMALIPDSHPEHLVCLSNLPIMLEERYRSTRNMDDFDKAILTARQVRSATARENPDFASWAYRLGRLLSRRLILNINKPLSDADLDNLEEKQEFFRTLQGLQYGPNIPEEEKQFFGTLLGLRYALHNPTESVQQWPLAQDLLEALDSFEDGSQCLAAIPRMRVRSVRGAVAILEFLQEWDRASEMAQRAVKLLPLVCGRHLNRKDQQHAIREISGVAATACSLSIKAGHVEQALQQVEFGRGLILGYLIDNKSDISLLKQADSSLADEFEEIRTAASRPIPDAEPALRQQAIQKRTEAAQLFNTCLERIRRFPGHESFLKEPELEELLKGAAEGPVVVVNITTTSSDAIIVSRSGVKSIELPEMSPKRASFLSEVFGRHSSMDEDDEDYDRDVQFEDEPTETYSDDFLSQLWTSCVKPILMELFKEYPESEKPLRIWWIGTGVASSLPFHAAGDYSQDATDENTLSQAISSYTPTIKALLHARSCFEKSAHKGPKASLLVVTMPKTPGHSSLPGVTKEASAIETAVGDAFTVKVLTKPSVESVMGEIERSDIVHFACHGTSDQFDPSNSHLLLHEQTSSGAAAVGKLTLQQISDSQSAGKAMIAYLSACSTAEVKAGTFADEALHIVSAFQVVGFGHVIGSLWSVSDEISVEVARLFYESLRGGNGQITNRAVAEALRGAVMSIRGHLTPRDWASYVHFGA